MVLRHAPPTKLMRDLRLGTAQACVTVIGQTIARSLTLHDAATVDKKP